MEMLMDADPIMTARELATHASDIKHLQDDMDKLVGDMSEVKKSLAEITKKFDQLEGGWKTLMWLGGFVSSVTAIVGYVVGHWSK
jgi:archaellum component FlaC